MNEIINTKTGEFIPIIVEDENGKLTITPEACETIKQFELQMKSIKEMYGEYKSALHDAMEEYGVKQIKTDDFIVTFIKATERISLDTKKVEAEHPDVFRECMKISDVKSSVRVKLKEEKQ